MILPLHIAIALISIVFSLILIIIPSSRKITISSYLVGLTLATGTILVVSTHSPMTQSCLAGLTFTAFSFVSIIVARRRLALSSIRKDRN